MNPGPPHVTAGVREGDVIAGKYRVDKILGRGGMGVVVAARHIQLDEKVALKFLLPDALDDPEAVARFLREARAAVKIKSEHVARVTDVGTLESGSPYMVMEYLEGGDLAEWLRQRGALPVEQAVDFVLQACVAVAEAHRLGIIHRDLKPANLFCIHGTDGRFSIKVLDFGISKLTDPTGTSAVAMTKTSSVMGSPLYMSPEQMRSSKDVDAGTDIWALGVVLFELIAGATPFAADSLMELGARIATEGPRPLRAHRPDAPAALETVILKCLEKDRRQRYRHVAELALALLQFGPSSARAAVERICRIIQGSALSETAIAPPFAPMAGTLAHAGTLPPLQRTTLGTSRGKSVVVGFGFAGVVMVGAVVTVAVHFGRGPEPHDVTQTQKGPPPQGTASAGPPPHAKAVSSTPAEAEPIDAPPPSTARPRVVETPPTTSPARSHTDAGTTNAPAAAAPALVRPLAADCSTPFTIDARGHHVPKPECL